MSISVILYIMNLPNGWSKQEDKLVLVLKCPDFMRALAMLNSFADISESMNHHPDLALRNYNEVVVSTTTHSVGKITDKDIKLAQEITDLIEYQDEKILIEGKGRE